MQYLPSPVLHNIIMVPSRNFIFYLKLMDKLTTLDEPKFQFHIFYFHLQGTVPVVYSTGSTIPNIMVSAGRFRAG